MNILSILAIIACGIGAYFYAEILGCLLRGGRVVTTTAYGKKLRWKRFWRYHTIGNTIRAVGIGLVVGLAHYLPRKYESPTWGFVFFVLTLALLAACTIWYVLRATRWSELTWFALLAINIILAAQAAVHVMALWWESRALSWWFFVTPWMVFALFLGFAAFVTALRKYGRTGAGVWKVVAVILAIATLISLVVIPVNGDAIAGLPKAQKALADAPTEANTTAMGKAIENLTVRKLTVEELEQLTYDKYKNVSEVLLTSSLTPHDKRRTQMAGFSDALTYGFETKEDAEKFWELEVEILRNPVYGVTVANAIRDKKIGDQRIGSFNSWMDEMVEKNDKEGVSTWCEYRGDDDTIYLTTEYRQYAATLCTFLERLIGQGVQTRQTVENWCLNNSSTNNARAGVKASYQYAKEALVLAYVGKDEAGKDNPKGLFVIGFNIHDKRPEFYGENAPEIVNKPKSDSPKGGGSTPGTTPTTAPEPGPTTTPGPSPTTAPSPTTKPTTAPTQTPTYNKDKSKSDNSGVNDNPGEGENTNNGKDAQYSTKDKDSNSNHMTATEYEQAIKDLEVINDNQKTGKDDSTPSYHGGGTVDNNGAAANKPSSQAPKEPEVSGDSSNQYWDGSGT